MGSYAVVWEMGSGYGHAHPVVRVVRGLSEAGHKVVVVARHAAQVRAAFARLTDAPAPPVLQTPAVGEARRSPGGTANHSEMLWAAGFWDTGALVGALRAYHDLFEAHAVGHVIAEYAPAALLAAHCAGVPSVRMGTGFTCPPDRDPMPCVLPGFGVGPKRLEEGDARLLSAVNAALEVMGSVPMERAAQVFGAQRTALTTYRELDHLGPRRDHTKYLGIAPAGFECVQHPEWPEGRGPRVAVYLRADTPNLGIALAAFSAAQGRFLVHVGGVPSWQKVRSQSASVRVLDQPFDARHLAAQADLFVCNGGHGSVTTALLAGTPVLALPAHPEQLLMGEALRRESLGGCTGPPAKLETLLGLLRSLPRDERVRACAGAFAETHAQACAGAPERLLEAIGVMHGKREREAVSA